MPYRIFTPGWVMHNPTGNPAVGPMWRSDWRTFWLTEEPRQKVSQRQEVQAPTGNPLVETIVDTFDTTVDKAVLWVGSSAATVWDSGGRAKLLCASTYSALATAATYDLTGSSFFARISPAIGGTGTRETFLGVCLDANNKVEIYVSGTTWACRKVIAGTPTVVSSTIWDSLYQWWRIRESGGTIYFEYSNDSVNWTNFGSTTVTFAYTAVWCQIVSGYYGTESAADSFVDNVNVSATGRAKVWSGAAWNKKPVKVWNGSAWVVKPVRVWTGTTWKMVA